MANNDKESIESSQVEELYFFRSLMEHFADRIYFKDLNSRIIYGNLAYGQLFGVEKVSDVYGKTDFDFFSESHAAAAFEDEQEIIRTGASKLNLEEAETWPDGHVTWVSTSKAPLQDDQGRIVGTLGISRDITAQKNVQEALVLAKKMESIGVLAAGVAHDFNNLLATMLAMNDMLLLKIPQGDPLRGFPEKIRDAGSRAADLVQGLLAFGGRQRLTLEVTDLRGLLRDLVSLIERNLGTEVVLQTFLDGTPLLVNVDAEQISVVVRNLVANARDAVEVAGTVTLRAGSRVLSSGEGTRDWAFFSVGDDGPGISEEIREWIFEPFFTTKEIGKGTGLGLSVVSGIVEQHNGKLELESTPGQGSLFTVYLPLRR